MTEIQDSPKRYAWLWLIPIFLLIFGLALLRMQSDGLWLDEVYTHVSSGTGGFPSISLVESIIRTAVYDLAWPPLYYIFQNIWGTLTGNSLLSERLLPSFFGILSVALSYRLGKELLGHIGGVFTALLIGTSAFFVYYLHETRAYTMYVFFCVLVVWFYWQFITRPNYKVRWLRWGFPLAIMAALYTHYVSGAFIAGILVYHLLFERPAKSNNPVMTQQRWLDIIRLWINGCLTFALWVGVLLSHVLFESGNNRAQSLLSLLDSSLYSFTNNTWLIAIPLLLLSLLLIRQRPIRFLWVWLICTIIFIGIMNLLASFLFHPRHFLALIPIFALLLSATLLEIYKRTKIGAITLVAIWVILGIFYSQQPDFLARIPKQRQPLPIVAIQDAQTIVETCVSNEDLVIFGMTAPEIEHQYSPPFRLYYFLNKDYRVSYIGALLTDNESITELPEELQTAPYSERVAEITSNRDTIWLIRDVDVDLTDEIMTLDTLTQQNGYVDCGDIYEGEQVIGSAYTRNSCEIVIESCDIGELALP